MFKVCMILSLVVLISSTSSAVSTAKTVAYNTAQKCAKQHGIEYLEMKKYMKGDFESKTEKAKVNISRKLFTEKNRNSL